MLTSAHVVGESGEVGLLRPRDRVGYTGTVVWRGTAAGRDDAALVHISDPGWQPPAVAAVVWGRTVTDRPRARCQSWGMPDFVQSEGPGVETFQATGRINPGTTMSANRYTVELDEHPPADLGRSPWQGISGAAVFCGDLLAGVIAEDPAHRSHAALSAVPAYVLLSRPGFRAAVEKYSGTAGLRWEPVELAELMDSQSPLKNTTALGSPSGLLLARRAVVPFRPGRETLLGRLHAWAGEPGAGVWLLHGPGGQGKTRLAHDFGEQLTGKRWSVLWLDPAHTDRERLELLGQVNDSLLVVIDYAESRPAQLATVLDTAATAAAAGRVVKVLLLARTVGDWWNDVAVGGPGAEELTESAHVTGLEPLDATSSGREATYRAAVGAFAATLPALSQAGSHDWDRAAAAVLDTPGRDLGDGTTVLGVQMQALADLLDTGTATDSASNGRTPEDRVLLHERRYWEYTMDSVGLAEVGVAVLEDTVAATAVLGPATTGELDVVIRRVPALSDQPLLVRGRVRDWLMSLYPGHTDTAFGGLAPDRIAEYLVGRRVLAPRRPSIIDTLATTLTDTPQAEYLLTVCTRAAAHPPLAAVGEHLTDWCARNPDTLLPAAIAAATRVEKSQPLTTALDHAISATSTETLQTLHTLIPHQTQALAPTATTLLQALVDRLRGEDDPHSSVLAMSVNNLAVRLSGLGRAEEALTAGEEATELYRTLATQRPDAYLPDLATSLNNLANQLGGLGRAEEALTAIEEAVQLRRTLATQRPETYLPDLAMSLNNLAVRLGELGRLEEALTAIEEAVQLRRTLATQRPDAYLPKLATSLNNLANRLDGLGRLEEALTAIEEAVQLHRTLATQRPDAYLPDLAGSLNNLANQLSGLGRAEQALTAIEEAVQLRRTLATQRPDAYLPDLA
ncbi:tetratricopeptide repeat protein, partial [Nocardia sp. NPDC057353]|uniref:tetratricopeptide repeat protein n=1 Tax=Nocardia sp. NPDC057353 TaxID=3346104 RepID=UPI00363E811A